MNKKITELSKTHKDSNVCFREVVLLKQTIVFKIKLYKLQT